MIGIGFGGLGVGLGVGAGVGAGSQFGSRRHCRRGWRPRSWGGRRRRSHSDVFFLSTGAPRAVFAPVASRGATTGRNNNKKRASGRSGRPGLPRLRIISPRLCPPPKKSVERKKEKASHTVPGRVIYCTIGYLLVPLCTGSYKKCALYRTRVYVAQRDGENGDSGCSSSVTGHNSGCSSSVTGNTSV